MAALGVVTAIANPALEAVVIAALATRSDEVRVVRRCVEIADALAVAGSGVARAVIVGEGLPGLDADIVHDLVAYGVVPIAVHEPEATWPITCRFPVAISAAESDETLAAALVEATRAGPSAAAQVADSVPSTPPAAPRPRGRIVAVWGAAGAPGRSTIALALADEASRRGVPALLVDADTYGGSLAIMLGLLDESPGLAAACRSASAGALDLAALARTCLQVGPSLRVLTGISRSDRWPELRPAAMEAVLNVARELAALTVVDCGFAIEQDEELAYDTLAPRRNGATITALERADEIVLVSGCDAVSAARGVRAAQELRELIPSARPRLVINKVRSAAFAGDAESQLRETFARFAALDIAATLPWDQKACDLSLLRGRVLADVASNSALRKAVVRLVETIVAIPGPVQSARRRAQR